MEIFIRRAGISRPSSLGAEFNKLLDIMKELPELGERLSKLQRDRNLSNTLMNIYNSIIHMHCNRILGLNPDDETDTRILMKRALEVLLNTITSSQ